MTASPSGGPSRAPSRNPGAATIAREAEAMRLRAAGMNYNQISAQLGLSRAQGHKVVQRALRRVTVETVTDMRVVEGARLESLQRAVWLKAMQGDLGAVSVALRIMAARAALYGLDQPVQIEHSAADGMAAFTIVINPDVALSAMPHGDDVPVLEEGGIYDAELVDEP